MRLVVFGASGGVGQHLLKQAVAAGHSVKAVVREPDKVAGHPVEVVAADLLTSDMVRLVSAVRGADAVLSAIGARSNALAGVVSRGTKAIIWAMREACVRRLVVVSAAPVRTTASPDRPYPPEPDPEDGVFYKYVIDPLIRLGLRPRLRDLARMEDALWNSGLNWTAVRPAQLTHGPGTGRYRTALGHNIPGGRTVSRADVAHFMLRALDQPQTARQAVGVAS